MVTGPAKHRRSVFFLAFAAALCALLLIGFARTFFLHAVFKVDTLTLALVVHGICGTSWFALLLWQAWLARSGRMADHWRVGAWGKAIVAVIVLTTAWVVIHKAWAGAMTRSGLAGQVGTFIQIGTTAWFATLAVMGFRSTARPDYHKRFILMATIAMMAPAFSRIMRLFRDGGPPLFDSAFFATPLIAALALHDWRTSGRIHPVTLWAGGGYLAFVAVRLPLARSPLWTQTVFPALFG